MLKIFFLFLSFSYASAGEKKVDPEVLYFSAKWCPSCQVVKPLFERLKKKHNIKILDYDKNEKLVKQFNVKKLPTVIILKDKKVIYSCSGSKTCKEIERQLKK